MLALCLVLSLALLAPAAGVAQDRSNTPAPERLWRAYPLDPRASPTAQPVAASSPAATADRRPVAVTRTERDGGEPVVVLMLLALFAAGGAVTFLRRRERGPDADPAPRGPAPVGPVAAVSRLWHGRSGRFTRSGAERAVVTAVSREDGGGGKPRAGDEAPASLAAAPRTSGVAAQPLSPPDPARAWTAEIEWRSSDGGARFCVITRGAGRTTLAKSPPLEWPPVGSAAVQAMTDATGELATALMAAGWKELPPGDTWYAKRFAWEPVTAAGAPAEPAAAADSAPVAAERGDRRPRLPRQQIALLCVLVALGPLAALALHGDHDNAPVKPAPTATTAKPAPKPAGSGGVDLTILVLVLLGTAALGLAIRETRRGRR